MPCSRRSSPPPKPEFRVAPAHTLGAVQWGSRPRRASSCASRAGRRIDRERRGIHARLRERARIGKRGEELRAQRGIETVVHANGAREVPGVHQHVLRQCGNETACVDAGGRRSPTAGTSTTPSNSPGLCNAARTAVSVTDQRRSGSSRGRAGLASSGRSNSTSWNPMTCSSTARASHPAHGDGRFQRPSTSDTTRPNRAHTRRCVVAIVSSIATTPAALPSPRYEGS